MLELGIPVGAGTDATRVASYNPWVSLYWLATGKTVGDVSMYSDKNCLSREEALRLYTQGSSWFSSESGKKDAIAPGQLAARMPGSATCTIVWLATRCLLKASRNATTSDV